jgi:hypothetical protein
MSYWDIAQMTQNGDLSSRIAAAASQEGIGTPQNWAWDHIWELCGSPGWSEAWASAVAGGNESPGKDAGVITDGMILSAVQAVHNSETPPE